MTPGPRARLPAVLTAVGYAVTSLAAALTASLIVLDAFRTADRLAEPRGLAVALMVALIALIVAAAVGLGYITGRLARQCRDGWALGQLTLLPIVALEVAAVRHLTLAGRAAIEDGMVATAFLAALLCLVLIRSRGRYREGPDQRSP